MPAKKPELYVCVESFVTPDGISVAFGDLAEAGAPIMKNRAWAFKPFEGPRFTKPSKGKDEPEAEEAAEEPELEQATAAPGEKRGAKK